MSGKQSQTRDSKDYLEVVEARRARRRFIVGITGVALLAAAYVARLYWVSPDPVEAQQKPAQARAPQTKSPITPAKTTAGRDLHRNCLCGRVAMRFHLHEAASTAQI